MTVIDGRVVLLQHAITEPVAARPELTVIDVADLLNAGAELVLHAARQVNVTIVVNAASGLRVRGERSQLMQVLVNLASNAIEAMAETGGGQLELRATASNGLVTIDVADTGPEIPPDRLERIWEAFYTTKPEGSGLGLSIVRGLVEQQPGASIAVRSIVGTGTTFTIVMPTAAGTVNIADGGSHLQSGRTAGHVGSGDQSTARR